MTATAQPTADKPKRRRSRLAAALPVASLLLAFLGAVEFARGYVGVAHPVFIASTAFSGVLFLVWIAQLVQADAIASKPMMTAGAEADPAEPEPPSRTARLLIALIIGLAAFLVSQVADRNGGAGHPVATFLIVAGITGTAMLTELATRNPWGRSMLGGEAALLATSAATYPTSSTPIRTAVAKAAQIAHRLLGSTGTIAAAVVVALGLNAFTSRGDHLMPLSGHWELGALPTVRESHEVPGAWGAERWVLRARPGCSDFACSYTVESRGLPTFVLRSTGNDTWKGVRFTVDDCVDLTPPYRLLQTRAYNAYDHFTFMTNPTNAKLGTVRVLDDAYARSGVPRSCPHATGLYEGDANRVVPGRPTASTPGAGGAGASAGSSTPGSPPQPAQPKHKARQESAKQRAADASLNNFLGIAFNQPVHCRASLHPASGSVAQLVCIFGRSTLVATRLRSLAGTHAFLRLRYRQAYPFRGTAGPCSNPGTQLGTWNDSTGRTRGPWGARQFGGKFQVLWGVDDSDVALVASGPVSDASGVCGVWYDHSG